MSSVAQRAAAGLGYLIGLQVVSRVLTFCLNVAVVRWLDPSVFGVATLQLQLVLTFVLLLAREGFRRACPRSVVSFAADAKQQQQQHRTQRQVNVMWLVVPVGSIVAAMVGSVFVATASELELAVPHYSLTIWLTVLAAVIELLAEPFYLLSQILQLFEARVRAEGLAVLVRCVVVFALVYSGMGLLAFAYSQLVYAFVLLVMYMMAFERAIRSPSKEREPSLEGLTSIKQLFPSIAHQLGGSWFDDTSLKLWLSFAFQAIEKLILTEGEKVVLRFGDSLLHQAAYGVVHNLGSLVARFLFQPVEEICFTLFAGLVGGSHEQQAEQTNNAATCARVLQIVLKFMVLIGSIFVAFGTNYSWLLLELLYQGRYGTSTGAPSVLMCYCLFVLLIGINGTSEAFVHAASSSAELKFYNWLLVAFSAAYMAASWYMIQLWHTSGLVLANCFNMALRITFNLVFISRFFAKAMQRDPAKAKSVGLSWQLRAIVPPWPVLCALVLSFALTYASERNLCTEQSPLLHRAAHVAVGVACLGLVVATVYRKDRQLLDDIRQLFRTRKTADKSN